VSRPPAAGPGSSALFADVTELLGRGASVLGGGASGPLNRLRAALGEPLTIAVAGHTNAGKSTLVNALIGSRIAPTAATECTRVITWFRFGPEQAQVFRLDGTAAPLWRTPDGRLPDTLPIEPQQVDHIEVALDFEPLRNLTVIDTPGLSGDEGLVDQTERLLAGDSVDVLLFVLGATLRATERDILAQYRRTSRRRYGFPANAHGVLSRADQLTGLDGPWAAAQAAAAAHAAELAKHLAGVVPVMGKIAETTETGAFTETHAGWLRGIAKLDNETREEVLEYPHGFLESDILDPILSRPQRQILLDLVDLHGIKALTGPEHLASRATTMYDTLRGQSGIAALRERINVLYVRPAAVHKAARVLAGIEKLLAASGLPETTCDPLLDRIQTIRDSPAMHTLGELRALTELYTGRCTLGDAATRDRALQLFERSDPADRLGVDDERDRATLADTAAAAVGFWRKYANSAGDLLARQVAETASRSAYLIHTRLGGHR
jgi:hypothetical protein